MFVYVAILDLLQAGCLIPPGIGAVVARQLDSDLWPTYKIRYLYFPVKTINREVIPHLQPFKRLYSQLTFFNFL